MGKNIGFSAKFDTNFDTFAVDMHEVIGSSPTIPTRQKGTQKTGTLFAWRRYSQDPRAAYVFKTVYSVRRVARGRSPVCTRPSLQP